MQWVSVWDVLLQLYGAPLRSNLLQQKHNTRSSALSVCARITAQLNPLHDDTNKPWLESDRHRHTYESYRHSVYLCLDESRYRFLISSPARGAGMSRRKQSNPKQFKREFANAILCFLSQNRWPDRLFVVVLVQIKLINTFHLDTFICID